jgi:serine phosphatase RsbU (regulator of sigma subunit)
VVSLIAAFLAQQLVRRRRGAEELAARLDTLAEENRQLYRDERNTSLTLQNALLSRRFPDVVGLEIAGRYVAAATEMAIGGDWYDIIRLDDQRTLFVIGDVSGHGVNAATGMAALRYAIRAYAGETSSPAVILEKLGRLLRIDHDHQLATVLCGVIDSETHEMTIASAGHPPPLLIHDGRREYVTSEHGPPVGVEDPLKARERTVPFPAQATLLAFTDGLIERRGEALDAGLARLVESAQPDLPLEALLDAILHEVAPEGRDDIALLGIRHAAKPARHDPGDRKRPQPIDAAPPAAELAP